MKSNSRSTIYLLLIAAALFGAAFIWYNFFTAKDVPPITSVSTRTAGQFSVGSRGLLSLLESLEDLSFDLGILDDPLYRRLQDLTPLISAPEARGRANPFAPLERPQ